MNHTSSWADILLQSAPTFPGEFANNEPMLENPFQRADQNTATADSVQYSKPQAEKTTVPSRPDESEDKFVVESIGAENQDRIRKKQRRGKHSRYVAAEGKDGEPDKTHIDVLVNVIQKSETSKESPRIAPRSNLTADEPSFPLLSSQNSLPSIETLQLDTAANVVPSTHERGLLDEMAGISSVNDQGANNVSFNVLDFLPENLEWNDLFSVSGNGQQNRYIPQAQHTWDQPNYQDPPITGEATSHGLPSVPQRIPSLPKSRQKLSENGQILKEKPKEDIPEKKTKRKPQFACAHPGCTAKFAQQQHLNTHMDSHKGVKQFRCDFNGCNKLFSQKGNLKVRDSHIGVDNRHIRGNIPARNHLYANIVIVPLHKREICKLIR